MRFRETAVSRRAVFALLLGAAAAASALGCASTPGRAVAVTPAVLSAPGATPLPTSLAASLRAGIVSLRVTGQEWNWRAPWEKTQPWTRSVTGLVVPGRRILVASTAFGNHLLVEAQKLGREERTVARVVLVDQEGPLALVEIDDASFWEGLSPLPFLDRAPSEATVSIHRW